MTSSPLEKGDRFNLCAAPFGPFRQIEPVPFFSTGLHTCYNRADKGKQDREVEQTLLGKAVRQFGLKAATRLHEAGIASNRGSATPR